jgi:hypothetical protein
MAVCRRPVSQAMQDMLCGPVKVPSKFVASIPIVACCTLPSTNRVLYFLMEAYETEVIVQDDGQLHLAGLPFKSGEKIHVVISQPAMERERPFPTCEDLLESGLVGLWADRDDIADSTEFSKRLREQMEHRGSLG